MTYATTFSGIGGWELGLNACGWELKWQCECEPFCRTLLKERFGVPIYEDIRTICEQDPPPVDALIGSPPCQPFSGAGEMLGVADERHLYPAFISLVRKVQPRWVLMEQVPTILSADNGLAFGQYIGGLAELGYCIEWHCIPARAAGACHIRNRLWIIAHTSGERRARLRPKGGQAKAFRCVSEEKRNEVQQRPEILSDLIPRLHASWFEILESPFRRGNDGVSSWSHRVHALGNAVIPQIPFLIGQAINQIEGLE